MNVDSGPGGIGKVAAGGPQVGLVQAGGGDGGGDGCGDGPCPVYTPATIPLATVCLILLLVLRKQVAGSDP